ncbi:Predicted O-methyltransferase YrrM [Thermoactinomyces sp. DSM 45891]|uniref:O-methyltransferase n=1 Tax=Thermoactinomyces sp. DSM 45891 TaxID=1761907 RepID=UPI00091FA9B8|nr:O-methyltransferase [Thermoactinomyces sp. DSM 45891]SFX54952.1 Predicted O-methyltransferase YrrM [Thermoactinomyces sp. DSM 45891]
MIDVQTKWSKVDDYISNLLVQSDPVLEETLEANERAGLPAIDVSPCQGKLLHLLAKLQGAQHILEIGTLGGYSTIWLARALPQDGRLVSLELDPTHAQVAQANIDRAGLTSRVEIQVGEALDSLIKLAEESPVFDMVFIDADKPNNPNYLQYALKFSRPGTLIVCDNVVREGEVIDENSKDPGVEGTRELFDMIAKESRLTSTAIQTVGGKGYDGFAVILVTE